MKNISTIQQNYQKLQRKEKTSYLDQTHYFAMGNGTDIFGTEIETKESNNLNFTNDEPTFKSTLNWHLQNFLEKDDMTEQAVNRNAIITRDVENFSKKDDINQDKFPSESKINSSPKGNLNEFLETDYMTKPTGIIDRNTIIPRT